jgi:hypothetical protein
MDPWQISSAGLPSEDFLQSLCSTMQDLGIDPRELERVSPTFLNFIYYLHEDIARLEEEVINANDLVQWLSDDNDRLRRQRNELYQRTGADPQPETPLRNDAIFNAEPAHARTQHRRQSRLNG